MCMWAVTSEYRSSDSDRARAAMISAARSSSPRPSPQPSGRRRAGPCMVSDYDRTGALEVIPNTIGLTAQSTQHAQHARSSEHQPLTSTGRRAPGGRLIHA